MFERDASLALSDARFLTEGRFVRYFLLTYILKEIAGHYFLSKFSDPTLQQGRHLFE